MSIAPSAPRLEDVLDAIKETAGRRGIPAERVDEPESNDRITDRILESIRRGEYALVDPTGARPNVSNDLRQSRRTMRDLILAGPRDQPRDRHDRACADAAAHVACASGLPGHRAGALDDLPDEIGRTISAPRAAWNSGGGVDRGGRAGVAAGARGTRVPVRRDPGTLARCERSRPRTSHRLLGKQSRHPARRECRRKREAQRCACARGLEHPDVDQRRDDAARLSFAGPDDLGHIGAR